MAMDGMAGEDSPMEMPMSRGRPMAAMHMAFFWGKDANILFSGWPGYGRLGMYLLALLVVFVLSGLVELLSVAGKLRRSDEPGHFVAGLVQTLVYAVKIGLAYMVMLAVMSFNVGVLLAAIMGHAVGFLIFRSGACRRRLSQLPLVNENAEMKD